MNSFTKDYLLDKEVIILQPSNGYRASTDAVILSSMINKLKSTDNILDVGSGTGAVSLCLAERFKSIKPQITGIELQAELAKLSNLSSKENHFDEFLNYINCSIKDFPKTYNNTFSHVISNPPYSEKDMPSPNPSKAAAHNHNDFNLKSWIDFCIKMLKPKGFFYMINRAENIVEILTAINGKLGAVQILPVYSKPEQNAKRIIVIAQKDSKAAAKILEPFIVHENSGKYNLKSEEILRKGKSYFEI